MIDRISLVLDAFDGWAADIGPDRPTYRLPRSSAHRMLERPVQLRWLRRSGRDYELGMRLVELGSLAVHQDRLVCDPLLHELHRATGLVVHLAVLDGADVVYHRQDRRPDGSAAIPTRVGARQPAQCAAVGKAIIAYNDHDDVDLSSRNDQILDRWGAAQLAAELDRSAHMGSPSIAKRRCRDSVASQRLLVRAAPSRPSRCGLMNRMMFDQRLRWLRFRMTAMGIWRNVEDGPSV